MNFPAWAATTNELVPREDLVGAIALNGIGFNLARALGPALRRLRHRRRRAGGRLRPECRRLPGADPGAAVLEADRGAEPDAEGAPDLGHAGGAALRLGQPGDARGHPPRLRLLPVHRRGLGPAAALRPPAARPRPAGLRPDAGRHGPFGGRPPASPCRRCAAGSTAAARCSGPRCSRRVAMAHPGHSRGIGRRRRWACCSMARPGSPPAAPWPPPPSWPPPAGCGRGPSPSTSSASSASWRWARRCRAGSAAASACRWRLASPPPAALWWRVRGAALADRQRGAGRDTSPPPALSRRPAAPAAELRGCWARPPAGCWRWSATGSTRPSAPPSSPPCRRCGGSGCAPAPAPGGLYEDVAQPDLWVELWTVDNWTEHLREQTRQTDWDRAALARAAALHRGEAAPEAARFLNVPEAWRRNQLPQPHWAGTSALPMHRAGPPATKSAMPPDGGMDTAHADAMGSRIAQAHGFCHAPSCGVSALRLAAIAHRDMTRPQGMPHDAIILDGGACHGESREDPCPPATTCRAMPSRCPSACCRPAWWIGIDLYNATRQAHWNVKGPHFGELHKLFEEFYNALQSTTDDLAERIVQLGGTAMAPPRPWPPAPGCRPTRPTSTPGWSM